jgi:hypothetical protein
MRSARSTPPWTRSSENSRPDSYQSTRDHSQRLSSGNAATRRAHILAAQLKGRDHPVTLIACPECGNQVSTQAVTCPKCGAPVAPPVKAGPTVVKPNLGQHAGGVTNSLTFAQAYAAASSGPSAIYYTTGNDTPFTVQAAIRKSGDRKGQRVFKGLAPTNAVGAIRRIAGARISIVTPKEYRHRVPPLMLGRT